MTDKVNDALRRALALAIARYVSAHRSAAGLAHKWLDEDERLLLDTSADALESAADEALSSLDDWEVSARADREKWETVRVPAVLTRLTLQSARSGSFETAAGPLADFLRDAGEKPQTLDVH
jgi:hypothetical protein